MSKTTFLKGHWESYRKLLPKDAPAVQVKETRRAFYAGAQATFHQLIMKLDDSSPDATPGDLSLMDEVHAELKEFVELVKNGVA